MMNDARALATKRMVEEAQSTTGATGATGTIAPDTALFTVNGTAGQQQAIKVLPNTGEKSTSAIATAGAVILTTALGMLGFSKRSKEY